MSARSLQDGRKHLRKIHDERLKTIRQARDVAERMATEPPSAQAETEYRALNRRITQLEGDFNLAKLDVEAAESDEEAAVLFGNAERNAGMTNPNMKKVESRYGVPLADEGRFQDLPDASKDVSIEDFGRWARSVLLPSETRAQSESVTAEGGALTPVAYSAPILDLAVNAMQVKAAGARIIPMDSLTQQVGKLDGDPQPLWRQESAAVAASSATFSAVTLTARSLACHVRVSMELLEDGRPDFGQVIAASLSRAFALELDRVALYGSGTVPEPRGLKNTAGVNITNFVGSNGGPINSTNGNYNAFVQTIGRLRAKNYSPTGIIYAPRTESTFGQLADSTGQYLAEPSYLRDAAPHLPSGQVPTDLTLGTSSDVSDWLTGDFSYLLVGVRSTFTLHNLSDAYLVSNGQLAFVATLRADVQVARPQAFEILTGLRA